MMHKLNHPIAWALVAALGVLAFATIALSQGESINAVWLITAALCVYTIAYRFYSRFIDRCVLNTDATRMTPAERLNDGLDYVPTNRWVVFGHHFAAIAGAGPLVGPVLAAQFGYLPGTLWILIGVVLAGAVQDFCVLFLSTRRDGKSLGDMIRMELGPLAGAIASLGIIMIMVIILAVLALVVVKALAHSPWGTFTIACTIPLAMLMGIYTRYIRPGRIGEVSVLGVIGLLLAIIYGNDVAQHPVLSAWFTFSGQQLAVLMMIYGFIAAVLPIWLLLAPRDYLSTFLKIGTIIGLALGIMIAAPHLAMPALSPFASGHGPIFAGNIYPFLFITIACGAVSGFHALVASGTTPKLVENEGHLRSIGYGAMLMESFVAIMALIAACVLDPAVYFAMNSPAALIGGDVVQAAQVISSWGFVITPEALTELAHDIGESTILSRAGGAPTLALGMAHILSSVIGGQTMMAFWYHFAILFEALFILTTIDAGTRVLRFMLQDGMGAIYAPLGNTESWAANLFATALAVSAWGYFLYQGVIDPLGGINTLWPLFGIANQMLAVIALSLVTVVLVKMNKRRYVWVSLCPTLFLLVTTLTAACQKLWHSDAKISFLAHATQFKTAAANNTILAPAKTMADMQQIILNDYIDAALSLFFIGVVVSVAVIASLRIKQAWQSHQAHSAETPAVYRSSTPTKEHAHA
jgi:carbon starvation protein